MKFTQKRSKVYAISAVLIAALMLLSAGSASAAALQQGDVITAVDNTPLREESALAKLLETHKPGDKLTLAIVRGTAQQNVQVTVGERPDDAQFAAEDGLVGQHRADFPAVEQINEQRLDDVVAMVRKRDFAAAVRGRDFEDSFPPQARA